MVFIYALTDPITSAIRYIGKSNNPVQRLREHISSCVKEKNHRACWIRSLKSKGLIPVINIIDEVSVAEWPSWEVAYIEFFREQGCDLVNGTLGGECGPGLSGAQHPFFGLTGSKHPRFGQPGANRGIKQSPETIAKKITSMTGKKRTLETRHKQSLAAKGQPKSKSHKAAIRWAKARRRQEYILAQLWR